MVSNSLIAVASRSKVIRGSVLFIGICCLIYIMGLFLSRIETQTLRELVRTDVLKQYQYLGELASILDRNGSISSVETIFSDCSIDERNQLDQFLDALQTGLAQEELVRLQQLFTKCGDFFSQRRNITVLLFEREVQMFENSIVLYEEITGSDQSERFQVSIWKDIVAKEREQAQLFSQLVVLQERVIDTLRAGESHDSETMKDILEQVSVVQAELLAAKEKSLSLRASLPNTEDL